MEDIPKPSKLILGRLKAISYGYTLKEIALASNRSEQTLKNNLKHWRERTGTLSTYHLLGECFRRGWLGND